MLPPSLINIESIFAPNPNAAKQGNIKKLSAGLSVRRKINNITDSIPIPRPVTPNAKKEN